MMEPKIETKDKEIKKGSFSQIDCVTDEGREPKIEIKEEI